MLQVFTHPRGALLCVYNRNWWVIWLTFSGMLFRSCCRMQSLVAMLIKHHMDSDTIDHLHKKGCLTTVISRLRSANEFSPASIVGTVTVVFACLKVCYIFLSVIFAPFIIWHCWHMIVFSLIGVIYAESIAAWQLGWREGLRAGGAAAAVPRAHLAQLCGNHPRHSACNRSVCTLSCLSDFGRRHA